MEVKLKPCPFCGAKQCSIALQQLPDGDVLYYCEECNTSGADCPTEGEARAAWNRRPIEDTLVDALYAYTKPDGCGPGCEDGDLCRMCQGEAALAKARGGA